MIPYLCASFLGIIPRFCFPGLVNRNLDIKSMVVSIFLYSGEVWFLYVLFLIMLVFPAVETIAKWNRWICLFFVLSLSLLLSNYLPKLFALNKLAYYLLFFFIGWLCRQNNVLEYKDKVMSFSRYKSISFLICGIIILFISGYIHGLESYYYLDGVIAILGMAVVLFFVLRYESVFCHFEKYSKYSMPLYLLNGYCLVASRVLIVNVLHITIPIVIILFNVFIMLDVSYIVIKHCMSKISVFRVMFGIPKDM